MDIRNHLRHVEGIEKAIVDNRLDTLVLGLGPSAWLVPWMDRKIISPLRLWGAHDIHRIIPVNDLVLFDSPQHSARLRVGTDALRWTLESRPDRLWLYQGNAKAWQPHLHHCMESVTKTERFFVWQNPKVKPGEEKPKRFELEWPIPHTGFVSPVGCTTLAWREGARRIGILGVEMLSDHNSHPSRGYVDKFFVEMATQAHEKGGCVVNLSPITGLKHFKEWQPPTKPSKSASSSEGGRICSGDTSTSDSHSIAGPRNAESRAAGTPRLGESTGVAD